MKVTEGVRRIIVEWHGKGVPPEETAQSLRVPHRRGEGHHPASPPGTRAAETARIPRTTVRAGKTRRHQRQ
jgi:hypothetical protein